MTSRSSTERLGDFLKAYVSHSFLGVFLGCLVFSGCCVWFCVWLGLFVLRFFWKTPSFLLSPILQHVGMANQRQNVLMTVRASSVHDMSSKKKDL